MKKTIKFHQKPNAEYKWYKSSDFSCQECRINEAVLKLEGSGWMFRIQGSFCENCAIRKIKYWYRKDTPKSTDLSLNCEDCGSYKDKQAENNRVLQELDMKDLLKEIQRRVKG